MLNSSNLRIGLRLLYNQSWLGGVNYVLSIGRMLRALPDNERPQIIFLTASEDAEAIAEAHTDIADEVASIEESSSLGLDFVYPATQLAEATFGAPWAGWIPDWQCQHYPDLFPANERVRRFLQYRALAHGPVSCFFSSQQAVDDTKALFAQPPEDVFWRVFHFPAVFDEDVWKPDPEGLAQIKGKFGLPNRYLITCNQFWRHKNHRVILDALRSMPDQDVHIVMTGAMEDSRWPDYANELRGLLDHAELAKRITLTGRIARDEQLKLLIGASGFLQPSLFEGWSTFVEEARAIGLPGLLSDIPVHREQSPKNAVFFDPNAADDLAEKLAQFWAAPPKKPDISVARSQHEAYVYKAARIFVDAAQEARQNYQTSRHDAATVMVAAASLLADESDAYVDASNKSESTILTDGPTREDYDRFFAGLRHLLRRFPEELARLSGVINSNAGTRQKEFDTQFVQATLSKMDEASRHRFYQYDANQDVEYSRPHADAVTQAQLRYARPWSKLLTSVIGYKDRAIDFALRKLS